ncbi:MAG: hypothetical protein H0U72_02545 [Nitrosospira sp.]|nr:hypothetical protein [Nitrosospira sp.]
MPVPLRVSRQAIVLPGALAASLFAVALPVYSDAAVLLTGPITPSEVSGFGGTPFTLGLPDGTYGVYGLMSAERDDKPCYIASMAEDVNDSSGDSGAIKNLCGGNATGSEMRTQFGDIKFARRTFVRALRVCMNNDNNQMKGFQIRGRGIDVNGNVIDLPPRHASLAGYGMSELADLNAPSDERLRCEIWKKWVECPQGQIATAVTAHFGPGSNPRSLTGLALECRAVSKSE